VSYTYQFNGNVITNEITDYSGEIIFDIPKELLVNTKSGLYTANFSFTISPENQDAITQVIETTIYLIPDNLYILLSPEQGTFYTNESTIAPYEYTPGYIGFNFSVYLGPNLGRPFKVTYYLDDNIHNAKSINVAERAKTLAKIYTTEGKWHKLTITTSYSQITYSADYYFYIKEVISTLSDYYLTTKPNQSVAIQ
jgi:hypothetical protein